MIRVVNPGMAAPTDIYFSQTKSAFVGFYSVIVPREPKNARRFALSVWHDYKITTRWYKGAPSHFMVQK